MIDLQNAMRRVITGDNEKGESVVIIDGGPSSHGGGVAGLFEIWEDAASGPLPTRSQQDLGTTRPVLGARPGNFQARWFVINPIPEGVPREQLNQAVRDTFAQFNGEHHIGDQTRHPAMHKTPSIDVVCLIDGDATLVLDGEETRLKPGNVVIQRGTSHAWIAHGGPALFFGVVIHRDLVAE